MIQTCGWLEEDLNRALVKWEVMDGATERILTS